ncbi:MAG: ChaN family lipoprotein [Phycisphaerales bacterium]|jgi:uncharacterized iron-regulated protein|nr:ChaN family lipoprotein [Phycisphaerales bacterium]
MDPMNELLISVSRSATERRPSIPPITGVLMAIWLGLATGCTTGQKTPPPPPDPRTLPVFDGTTEASISWDDLIARANAAEVIVIGEEHDDPGAHAVQLAIFKAVLSTDSASALSLEMLERDEQDLVDAWLAGSLETDDFVEQTGSRNWGGEEGWYRFYQPALDAARTSDAPIVAANAPRRYVSRARKEGYDVLRALPEEERDWFDIPPALDDGPYYERFAETMRGFRGDEIEEEAIIATFRSQQVWDATMARSITMAMDDPQIERVIHFIGRFHSDLEGGTIGEIRRLRPETDLLVISCVRRDGVINALDPEDLGRGDVVVYTPGSTSAD